ncbi:RNA polymerase sigma-70 factor [Solitalea canadensis]|uniref:RNA polymerase sigma-70 factor, Bacteroides expansion family 1 n=1 Tax=Solitalea canadensis (strain ATCC 29591 / DSM 3403 / JCM 21819 / LMG 8368 / NBRC 15130 / NCIMB 12057 / USAM 9D) TaxID=929556 RepID=H8KT71_SOLCM|nr:RNA polymerase sigma-70 factor [Solitalea canadensis]AFD05254.1 RNA polymerase sigma-70 factor, Bacteroides expansion family 1 [Solitalea canadensis DSM 3403]
MFIADSDQDKSRTVFKELFDFYAPKIYSFGNSYLKSNHDAEELVQEVFIRMWNQRDVLDDTKNIKAYIFKTAVNLIYDQLRKRKLEKLHTELSLFQHSEEDHSTLDYLSLGDLQNQINGLIAKMPEQRRLIFTLSRVDGLSYDEIAQQLNISKRTVENQVYRAMSFLKEHIDSKYMLYLVFFYFC